MRPAAPATGPGVMIEADHVRKQFRRHTERATSLKERLVRRRGEQAEDFVALQDISLQIEAGSTVGLIGPNGSGKSTLLKILSGILRPTSGTVRTYGRIASLLELGAGFNGELTGRENVFLNASLLGLTRAETEAAMDSIIDFAELADFIDQPVKHYSSGMYVRLGFAVAVHVDPDILLVDEVLAVGDEAFQRKCMDRIHDFQAAGKTILFVSHSLAQVEELCTRAIVLSRGVVIDDGTPEAAIHTLRRLMGTDTPVVPYTHTPDDGFAFGEVWMTQTKGDDADPGVPVERAVDGPFQVHVRFTVNQHWATDIDTVQFVGMGDHDYPLLCAVVRREHLPHRHAGTWEVSVAFPDLPALYGHVRWSVQVSDGTGRPLAHTRSKGIYAMVTGDGPTLLSPPAEFSSRVVEQAAVTPR